MRLIFFAALLALAAPAEARPVCRAGAHCVSQRHRPILSGHVLTPGQRLAPNAELGALPRATFTDRPVQPGYFPPPAFEQNNLPPVFQPQPLH